MDDAIVNLNVGGTIFSTTRATLCGAGSGVDREELEDGTGNTFFDVLLSERIPSLRDDTGAYFIDRDPHYFAVLLEYLRTGELVIPEGLSLRAILREAAFFCIPIPSFVQSAARERAESGYLDTDADAPAQVLHSNGFYVISNENGSISRLVQFCCYGRLNLIAPRTRPEDLTASIGLPDCLVVSPTIRYTYHTASSLVFVDERELSVQNFGVERNFVHRHTCLFGVTHENYVHIAGTGDKPSWRMDFHPSVPPLMDVVYHLQQDPDRKTHGSTVMMLQFVADDSSLFDRFYFAEDASPADQAPVLTGTAHFAEIIPSIYRMRFVTAPFSMERVRTRVTPDLRGRRYVPVHDASGVRIPWEPSFGDRYIVEDDDRRYEQLRAAQAMQEHGMARDGGDGSSDDGSSESEGEGDGAGARQPRRMLPNVIEVQPGEGDDHQTGAGGARARALQEAAAQPPAGLADGENLLWRVSIDHDRFESARLFSLGPILVEEMLGTTAVYVAASSP